LTSVKEPGGKKRQNHCENWESPAFMHLAAKPTEITGTIGLALRDAARP
jgi:hypothetical protein